MKRSTVFALTSASLLAVFAVLSWPGASVAEPGKPKTTMKKHADVAAQLDKLIEAEWNKQGLTPSEPADDAEFLRRVRLDITGQIPSADEVRAFLMSNDPDKRAKKVDELLDDPLYAEHWSFIWINRLVNTTSLGALRNPQFVAQFRPWFTNALATNMPYDQFAREIVTAKGEIKDNGATAWAMSYDGEEAALAGSASRIFLGVQIQCAQCHDSKVNEWKMGDFWGVAAFFARTQTRRILDPDTKMPKGFEVIDLPRGEAGIPDTSPVQIVEPKYLEGRVLFRPGGKSAKEIKAPKNPDRRFISGPADGVDRRIEFASWMTSEDNKWFSKAAVNWMWGHFLGAGFVVPEDDLDVTNPPSNPAALDLLTKDFRESGYDVKRLIRLITKTRAYQLSSKPTANNAKDDRYYSHGRMLHMTPDQTFYSLMAVTGIEDSMARGMDRDRVEQLKARFLAGFVFLFGNDEGESGDLFQGTIPQALLYMNSPQIQGGMKVGPGTTLGKILQKVETPEGRLDEMYLTTLGRFPNATERTYFTSVISKYQNSKLIYEDIYWALVNSSEFQFNH